MGLWISGAASGRESWRRPAGRSSERIEDRGSRPRAAHTCLLPRTHHKDRPRATFPNRFHRFKLPRSFPACPGLTRGRGDRWRLPLTLALVALGGTWPGGVLRPGPAGRHGEGRADGCRHDVGSDGYLPLARYVSREKLILYVEFAGLDAHAAAWKNTAASKMLNETPLGVMLEEVAAQLFDKGMGYLPTRKVSGAELVTFLKAAARNGWVLSVGAGAKGSNPLVGTLVLRGAAVKDLKSITSRLMGMMMAVEPRPKIDRRAGRVLIAVPRGSAADAGWTWWPEKNDLVVGFVQSSDADAIIASLDGKSESASGLPLLSEPLQGGRLVRADPDGLRRPFDVPRRAEDGAGGLLPAAQGCRGEPSRLSLGL